MKIEISDGEFIDRLSILLIKEEKGLDVSSELKALKKPGDQWFDYFLSIMVALNKQLWDIESAKRTSAKRFSLEYSELSTLTIQLNDLRHEVKKQADLFYGSKITEKKDHSVR